MQAVYLAKDYTAKNIKEINCQSEHLIKSPV